MRAKLLLLPLACFTFLSFPTVSTWGNLITFDELSESASGSFIANGYQGLVWSNFVSSNAILATNLPNVGVSGFYYGMVSASNEAYNAFGGAAEIDSQGTNFNFLSVYLTAAYNTNLNVDIQGFSGTNLLYNQIVVPSATNPTLFTFNYLNIDRLTFNAFGGQSAGFNGGVAGPWFAMDNLTFDLVPEPSSLLLAAAGALLLCPLLKRKRVP